MPYAIRHAGMRSRLKEVYISACQTAYHTADTKQSGKAESSIVGLRWRSIKVRYLPSRQPRRKAEEIDRLD